MTVLELRRNESALSLHGLAGIRTATCPDDSAKQRPELWHWFSLLEGLQARNRIAGAVLDGKVERSAVSFTV